MQDKSWHIEPLEVFREISLGKSLNAFVDGFVPCEHRYGEILAHRSTPGAKKSRAGLEKPLRQGDWRQLSSVGKDCGPELVKLFRQRRLSAALGECYTRDWGCPLTHNRDREYNEAELIS